MAIPIAFDTAAEETAGVGADFRRQVRDDLHDDKLLARCANDIQRLLPECYDEALEFPELEFGILSLCGERCESVPGGVGYGDEFLIVVVLAAVSPGLRGHITRGLLFGNEIERKAADLAAEGQVREFAPAHMG